MHNLDTKSILLYTSFQAAIRTMHRDSMTQPEKQELNCQVSQQRP